MTSVLSAGEIDLSVGAVAGLATVTVAMGIAAGGPIVGVGAGIATGLAVGMFNGWLTTRIGIPSFLTTLAMMGIAKGVAMWISATAAVPILSPGYSWLFGGGNRSEEHTSELQSLMRISYAVFCLKKKKKTNQIRKYDSILHH